MKKILLLSDLHVGSLWGLWPPGFETIDTRTGDLIEFKGLTNAQKMLWKKWNAMIKEVRDPECIILNGDLIDGIHRRSRGRGTVSTNLTWQTEACLEVLDSLPQVPMYFTQGTEYHELEDGRPVEEHLAKEVGGEFGDDLIIDECGIRLHVGHSIPSSASTWQYWTTAIARDLLLLAIHSAEEKYGKIDVAVRSHRHNFCCAIFRSQIGLITPGWQIRTPYAVMKDLVSPPDIGYVVLHVGDNKKSILVDRSGIDNQPVPPSRIVGRDMKLRKVKR